MGIGMGEGWSGYRYLGFRRGDVVERRHYWMRVISCSGDARNIIRLYMVLSSDPWGWMISGRMSERCLLSENLSSCIYVTPPLSGYEWMGLVLSLKLVMECRGDSRYLSLHSGFLGQFSRCCYPLYAIPWSNTDRPFRYHTKH